jgi:hypothetical protein
MKGPNPDTADQASAAERPDQKASRVVQPKRHPERKLLGKALSYKIEGLLGRYGCPTGTLGHGVGSDLDAAVFGVKQFTDSPIDAQLYVDTPRVLRAGIHLD